MAQRPRRIALINQKGGVGKTTTAANLGAALARAGRRVLLIDMDPQSHLTIHMGLSPNELAPSIYDVLTDGRPLAEAIHAAQIDRLAIAPSTKHLAGAEVELVDVVGREMVLRDAVNALPAPPPFDYLLVDCPPSLGLLTLNALAAAEEVFICLQPHFLALEGVGRLLETVGLVQQRINPALRVTGVVLCMYETGTRLASEVTDDLASFLGQHRGGPSPWGQVRVFDTVIRRNIKLAECPSFGQVIFQYAPTSHGAADYQALADEVLAMEPSDSNRPAAEAETPSAAPAAAPGPLASRPGDAADAGGDPAEGEPNGPAV